MSFSWWNSLPSQCRQPHGKTRAISQTSYLQLVSSKACQSCQTMTSCYKRCYISGDDGAPLSTVFQNDFAKSIGVTTLLPVDKVIRQQLMSWSIACPPAFGTVTLEKAGVFPHPGQARAALNYAFCKNVFIFILRVTVFKAKEYLHMENSTHGCSIKCEVHFTEFMENLTVQF